MPLPSPIHERREDGRCRVNGVAEHEPEEAQPGPTSSSGFTSALEPLGFEPEITAKVAKLGYRIYEVAICQHARTCAEGKKIGWRDRMASLYQILPYRLFD